MEFLQKQFADKLVDIACQQFRVGSDHKKTRMESCRKNEEFYYGRKIVVPKGRFGVPFPVMAGFVDTLMSKIDDAPFVNYHYTDLADLKISKKVSAMWRKESKPNMGNWNQKDRWSKKLACFSGRAIFEDFSESKPKYRHISEVIDHEDFVCEPKGGGDLEQHLFCGKDNVFRTNGQMKQNARSGLYESGQVDLLLKAVKDKEYKNTDDIYASKNARYKQLGIDLETNTYVGQPINKLIEWCMNYEGKRYYLLFDYNSKIWVRAHLLKDVFESDLYPFTSWATHEDAFNFWSKAPCDDVRPIADTVDTLLNTALDNRAKINMGQRAYDSEIFPDPSQLEWREDGLVGADTKGGKRTIQEGIYEFKTPEVSGTIEFASFLDNFLGRKTGITPEVEGAPDKDQKVGIYFGNLQQMADRLGLYNKSYRECYDRRGLRYAWGLYEHLTEPELVKIIGEEGVEWEELTRGEAKKAIDFDIEIAGGSAEIIANEAKSKKRENSLGLLLKRNDLMLQVNPQWVIKEILKTGEYEEEEVKMALSKEGIDLELMSEASQAIQEILKGKKPKLNRGANTSFMQKIIDFAYDNEIELEKYKALIAYALAHKEIALQNMTRLAGISNINPEREVVAEKPMLKVGNANVEEPMAGAGAGVSSQVASNLLRGRSPAVA